MLVGGGRWGVQFSKASQTDWGGAALRARKQQAFQQIVTGSASRWVETTTPHSKSASQAHSAEDAADLLHPAGVNPEKRPSVYLSLRTCHSTSRGLQRVDDWSDFAHGPPSLTLRVSWEPTATGPVGCLLTTAAPTAPGPLRAMEAPHAAQTAGLQPPDYPGPPVPTVEEQAEAWADWYPGEGSIGSPRKDAWLRDRNWAVAGAAECHKVTCLCPALRHLECC